jgi:hypothetical protein
MTQKSKITFSQWFDTFDGMSTIGCALRERGFYYILLEELPEHRDRRRKTDKNALTIYGLASYIADEAPNEWVRDDLFSFSGARIAVARTPTPQCVVSGGIGGVYYTGSGESGVEPQFYPVTRIRQIEGWLYATHLSRGISIRRGVGKWESFESGIKAPLDNEGYGFKDISGFSETDLYAVGGKGDVWHWNGSLWSQCAFPSNIYLETVLCAGDGNVYITGQNGIVYVGGGNKWKKLDDGGFAHYFNDTVWYDGKVWLANDSGLYYLDAKGNTQSADLPAEIHVTTGYLSVGDGLMLSAGVGGVSVYDGKRWELIVNHFEMQRLATEQKKGKS